MNNVSGNLKQFQYKQQLFNNTAHLYGHFEFEAWIKRSNLSVLSGRLNRNTNRTCIVLVHNDKSRQNCNTISPARLATFYFSSRYFISTLISSSILELNVQNTMKYQQIYNIMSNRVILSEEYRRYCGSFLWKWMKINTSFLFSTKNPNDPGYFFYLILDFGKETHFKSQRERLDARSRIFESRLPAYTIRHSRIPTKTVSLSDVPTWKWWRIIRKWRTDGSLNVRFRWCPYNARLCLKIALFKLLMLPMKHDGLTLSRFYP